LDVVLVAIGLAGWHHEVDNGSDGALLYGSPKARSGSICYGMTIDHVRELDVEPCDADFVHVAPVDEAESAHVRHRPPPSRAPSTDSCRIVRELLGHRRGFPKFWRRACDAESGSLEIPIHNSRQCAAVEPVKEQE
jgi:hypothetical protein